ncbi:endolytic transglycosylase MltG, partial [Bdellovibrionota bacterium FG-2]
ALYGVANLPMDSSSSEKRIVIIQRGQSPQDISRLLENEKIISDARIISWAGRITRQWKKVKAGEYEVSAAMSPLAILSVLASGISIPHPLTVREGENIYEIAADLEAKGLSTAEGFLELCKNEEFIEAMAPTLGREVARVGSLEGYLYPDTYHLNRTMSTEDIVRAMVRHSNERWTPKEEARARELRLSRHQVLTLASVVEKETGAPEERPRIASVFFNRIKKRMRLQSDPTTIYGIWKTYQSGGQNLHRSDLSTQTPYNTYAVNGLPVGPIANPGAAAIQAVLYPSETNDLYFVSHNNGTHQFSADLDAHNRAVRKFQLDRRAREGKSWRDIQQRDSRGQ